MKKILSFIINDHNKILLLRNNATDPIHGGDIWYTVTGGFEPGETDGKEVCKREIKEETNLDIIESIYLNLILKYTHNNIECEEYVYVSFTQNIDVILDTEENVDYKWCSLNILLKEMKWYGDSMLLKLILKDAINRKVYLREETTEKV